MSLFVHQIWRNWDQWMGAVRWVCLFIRFGEIEISEWVPSDEFVCLSDLEKLRSVNGCRQMSLFVYQIWRNWDQWMGAIRWVCLFIRFGEIEISEWVPSDEFVCSSDLEKLRSMNGCRQMNLFVYQIWRNWDQWMGAVRWVCLFIRFGEIEISEWVPSEEFVCSSDLEKLRSVNGCRQRSLFIRFGEIEISEWGAVRSLFVNQIWRNWDQWMGAVRWVCLFIRFGEIEISEWVPSEEFVCSSDLEKLRSVNVCHQRSLFVH